MMYVDMEHYEYVIQSDVASHDIAENVPVHEALNEVQTRDLKILELQNNIEFLEHALSVKENEARVSHMRTSLSSTFAYRIGLGGTSVPGILRTRSLSDPKRNAEADKR